MYAELRAVQSLVKALIESVNKMSSCDLSCPPLPTQSRSVSRRQRRQATLRKLYAASLTRGSVPAAGEMASQGAIPVVVQAESTLPGCESTTPQLVACEASKVGIVLESCPDQKFGNGGDEAVRAQANLFPSFISDEERVAVSPCISEGVGQPLPQLLTSCSFLTIAEAGQAVAVSYLVCQAVQPAIAALVYANGGDTVHCAYSPEASGLGPMFGDSTLPDDSQPAAGWGPLFPAAERLGPSVFDNAPQPGAQECKQQ